MFLNISFTILWRCKLKSPQNGNLKKHIIHLSRNITHRLCIKVGRGQGDGDIGTRVWGLGTWGRKTRNLRTSSMGRGDVWDEDAGTSNTGTHGTQDVNDYRKSRR